MRDLGRGLRAFWNDPSGRAILAITLTVIGIGTVFYRFVEDLRWIDSLYVSVITGSTVGFGDITPETVDAIVNAANSTTFNASKLIWPPDIDIFGPPASPPSPQTPPPPPLRPSPAPSPPLELLQRAASGAGVFLSLIHI